MSEGSRNKTLAQLGFATHDALETPVSGIALDSRHVREGTLFAALPGTRTHGAAFVEYALRQGAGAILTDTAGAETARAAMDSHGQVPLIVVEDAASALAGAAALWFGAQPDVMVGVTGTNGKTSVASFTRQIWQAMGLAAINIGTTGVEGDFSAPLQHTTPDALTLQKALADAAGAGITHAAMEASSHGLDQKRLEGVRLMAAGFTNLSQDHLDYHPDFESYFDAKAGLFERVLPDSAMAVICTDSAYGADMAARAEQAGLPLMRVGRSPDDDLRIQALRFDADGQDVRFSWGGVTRQARLNLIGGFQAENVMLAAGLAIASGSEPAQVFAVLDQLEGVRGRMQWVARRKNGASVYVDYAHTPDALATALQALRPHVMGRLIVVFGAGGDRDTGKRPLMGAAASEHADMVFVTDDNPRSEDPADIRRQVLEGCPNATEVGDRAEAILRGVDALEGGDVLLVAGKGHETGQIMGDQVFPFDDAEQASVAVAALDGLL